MLIFAAVMLLTMDHIQVNMAKHCGPNENELDCAPLLSCQPTCDKPNGMPCPRICDVNACVCNEGFIRDHRQDLLCIPSSGCNPVNETEVPECGENQELSECANPCQPSCEKPDRAPCLTLRCAKGCVCCSGYTRQTNDPKSPCIQCPITLK